VSKRGSPTGLRRWLALWLVGLVLAVSGAPCSGIAAPRAEGPSLSAPADPCQQHAPAAAQACLQIACQAMIAPGDGPTRFAPRPGGLAYGEPADLRTGRHERPPLPPPRLPMS